MVVSDVQVHGGLEDMLDSVLPAGAGDGERMELLGLLIRGSALLEERGGRLLVVLDADLATHSCIAFAALPGEVHALPGVWDHCVVLIRADAPGDPVELPDDRVRIAASLGSALSWYAAHCDGQVSGFTAARAFVGAVPEGMPPFVPGVFQGAYSDSQPQAPDDADLMGLARAAADSVLAERGCAYLCADAMADGAGGSRPCGLWVDPEGVLTISFVAAASGAYPAISLEDVDDDLLAGYAASCWGACASRVEVDPDIVRVSLIRYRIDFAADRMHGAEQLLNVRICR